MISSDTLVYTKEILLFLKTITLKYSPFADLINTKLVEDGYPVLTDPRTWKYYLNASGEYHASDTLMYIRSLDTGEEVPYTKETLASHPKTQMAYNIGQVEYNNLCLAYPEQVDLIKSITYPVVDLNAFIAADDLTLHAYYDGILDPGEQETLLFEYRKFLQFMYDRWYLEEFGYEEFYAPLFFQSVIFLSVQCLLAMRIRYMHTTEVHTFHVWEYLRSQGLADYRDILTRDQALFLYRNIEYIKANRGKQSTLKILAEHILGNLNVGMVGKTIYHTTDDTKDAALWKPQILSIPIDSKDDVNFQDGDPVDVDILVNNLYASGFDPNIGVSYSDEVEATLSATPIDRLSTKVLEIKKYTLDNKYEDMLDRFILDTLVYRINAGTYAGDIGFTDSAFGNKVQMSLKEALALWHYAITRAGYRALEEVRLVEQPDGTYLREDVPAQTDHVVNLPTSYTYSLLYKDQVASTDVVETIDYFGHTYHIKSWIDSEAIIAKVPHFNSVISIPDRMSKLVADQFLNMVADIQQMRQESSTIRSMAWVKVYDALVLRETQSISLSPVTTYADWFKTLPTPVQAMLSIYDAASNAKESYDRLATDLLNAMLPIVQEYFGAYGIDTYARNKLYARLKALFVQLCSYNVIFLDTDRQVPLWAMGGKLTIAQEDIVSAIDRLPISVEVSPRDTEMIVSTKINPSAIIAINGDAEMKARQSIDTTASLHSKTTSSASSFGDVDLNLKALIQQTGATIWLPMGELDLITLE